MSEKSICKRRVRPGSWLTPLVLTSLWVAPATLAAQETVGPSLAQRAQEIESRLIGLEASRARAYERFEQWQLRDRSRSLAGTDTLRVGPLRIIVPREQAPLALESFQSVWAQLGPMLGEDIPPELEEHLFGFQYGRSSRRLDLPIGSTMIHEPRRWPTAGQTRPRVRNAVGDVLYEAMESPGKRWFNDPISGPATPARIHRRLSLAPSTAAKSCLSGEMESCWVAMGATGNQSALDDVRLWFDERERVEVVRGLKLNTYEKALGAECLAEMAVESCEQILVGRRDAVVPLDRPIRARLVNVALGMGGEGAYARLASEVQRGSDPRVMIAAVARAPSDEVMAEWHRQVLAAGPRFAEAGMNPRVVALFWILLFLALSTRSTRWRLG